MALNQINKLVWIVETISRVGMISFEELNRKWMDNQDLSWVKKCSSEPSISDDIISSTRLDSL